MLSKRGGRSAGGERRNRVIPASLIAILEADNPLQCELKRIILNEPVLFMPGKTFSKLLHCITGYCILCDNEQFFSFRQVRARLLINRKKGDVLLTWKSWKKVFYLVEGSTNSRYFFSVGKMVVGSFWYRAGTELVLNSWFSESHRDLFKRSDALL